MIQRFRTDSTLPENLSWDTTGHAGRFSLTAKGTEKMKKRRVEMVVETHRIWIVRQPGLPAPAWCSECARTVRMVTADEAAGIVRQSTRIIYHWVETRRLHYRETPAGSVLVCLDSLLAGATEAVHRVPEMPTALERQCAARVRDYGQET
jgi:hypothetical protein